jgi:hypothetical protein
LSEEGWIPGLSWIMAAGRLRLRIDENNSEQPSQ